MRDARLPLTFASLDEVMPDVDQLLRGHTTVGNWSLGQVVHFTIGFSQVGRLAPLAGAWRADRRLARPG